MKKIIFYLFFTFCLGFVFFLFSCDDRNEKNEEDIIPTFKDMYIKAYSTIEGLSFNEHKADDTKFDKDIEDIASIDTQNFKKVDYVAHKNEYVIILLTFDNPSGYNLYSVGINDNIYYEYSIRMTKDNNFYIVISTPSESGCYDYTLNSIKYIDKSGLPQEMKLDSEKTVVMGVVGSILPTATIESQTINASSASFDINLTDTDGLIKDSPKKMFISDESKIIFEQDLKIGLNHIECSNLSMNKEYQYIVLTAYYTIVQEEAISKSLLKGSFKTLAGFNITNEQITNTSISFDVEKLDENANLLSISLYDAIDNTLISTSNDLSNNKFTKLLSHHEYKIRIDYSFLLNDNMILDYYEYEFSTQDIKIPVISLENSSNTYNAISYDIVIDDVENVCNVTSVKLYNDDVLVSTNDDCKAYFDNLNSYTDYKIVITYQYDLNDGNGVIDDIFEFECKTDPYLRLDGFSILNTSGVINEETIFLKANVYNPDGAIFKSVTINNSEYEVDNSSTTSVLFVNVNTKGKFSVGELTLTLQDIKTELDGQNYTIYCKTNNQVSLYIYPKMVLESVRILDSNYEPANYGYINDAFYLEFKLLNSSEYDINSISYQNKVYTIEENIKKLDNITYMIELSNLVTNWNEISLGRIRYCNTYIERELIIKDVEIIFYGTASNDVICISSPDDLLNMDDGYYYELIKDIDLTGIEWKGKNFDGVFNGNGYSICNMSLVSSYTNKEVYAGLFMSIDGIIKNLNLKGIMFRISINNKTEKTINFLCGGLASQADTIILDNIKIDNTSFIDVSATGKVEITTGGLIGRIGYGDNINITNCTNEATISGYMRVGGLIGCDNHNNYSQLVIKNCNNSGKISGAKRVGGLVGDITIESFIDNCYNTGLIAGANSVGGIAGCIEDCNIINCYNSGMISGENGVAGLVGGSYEVSKITDCYNIGEIIGVESVAGLVGYYFDFVDQTITNCYNSANITGDIEVGGLVGSKDDTNTLFIQNCYNSGSINGNSSVGGLLGRIYRAKFLDSYNIGDVSGNQYIGGLIGETEDTDCENTYNSGHISGVVSTGGLAGFVKYLDVINSYNEGEIEGSNMTGGLAGTVVDSLTIKNCYNNANISGDSSIGGIIGADCILDYQTSIQNCYNIGKIKGNYEVGGIVGRSHEVQITNCFNAAEIIYTGDAGGLIGEVDMVEIINSYTLDSCAVKSTDYNGEVCTKQNLNDKSFYLNTLLWSIDDWNLDNLDFDNSLNPTLN